ncbi:MAG: type II secretion system protein [Candidatus Aphodocola sp.]
MKKNNKGFTLVELLAVIVVLGIIMSIAGTAVLKQKKKANLEEAKKLEKTIADLGPSIYSYEYLLGDKEKDGYFYKSYKNLRVESSIKISFAELKEAGYLKSETISNPAGNGNCEGYLEVKKGPEFNAYISCDNLYETSGYVSDSFTSVNLTNKN